MTLISCSFTGHRSIPDVHRAPLADLVRRAIAYVYEQGCRTFYAGGAVGFDTLAAREVLRFRMAHPEVRLVLLLPCPEQAATFGDGARDAYDFLLREADEVRYVCSAYTPRCMRKRNELLAELGDCVIAYVGHGRSGSSQTARMATERGKHVYNLFRELMTNG